MRAGACVYVCVRVYALRVVSTDTILCYNYKYFKLLLLYLVHTPIIDYLPNTLTSLPPLVRPKPQKTDRLRSVFLWCKETNTRSCSRCWWLVSSLGLGL